VVAGIPVLVIDLRRLADILIIRVFQVMVYPDKNIPEQQQVAISIARVRVHVVFIEKLPVQVKPVRQRTRERINAGGQG